MIDLIFHKNYLKRLDNIIQWQEKDVLRKESVAQHSYKVAVFARVLVEEIFNNFSEDFYYKAINDFKLEVTTYAIFHDWDEAMILRDMSHETKYNKFNGGDIRQALNSFSKHEVDRNFSKRSDEELDVSVMLRNNSIGEVSEAVKVFVKYCDWLALGFFLKREVEMGNVSMQTNLDYCIESTERVSKVLTEVLIEEFEPAVLNLQFIQNIYEQ